MKSLTSIKPSIKNLTLTAVALFMLTACQAQAQSKTIEKVYNQACYAKIAEYKADLGEQIWFEVLEGPTYFTIIHTFSNNEVYVFNHDKVNDYCEITRNF
jgi:uncharacterized membrane protein